MQNAGPAARRKPLSLRSAVVLQPAADGDVTPLVIYKQKRKRRVSREWRPLEKMLRRVSNAQAVTAEDYLRRHRRSSGKKRNGAIRDLGKNMWRAQRKGRKKLRIRFL